MYKVYMACIIVGCMLIFVSLVGVGYIVGRSDPKLAVDVVERLP